MAEMLKVQGSKIKASIKPSKAIVKAMPGGFTAQRLKWEEEDARAKAFREEQEAKRAAREEARKAPKMNVLWDNQREFAYIQRGERKRIVISICTKNGYRYVNIRQYYYHDKLDDWRPTRNGIAIPLLIHEGKTRKPDPNNPPRPVYPMKELMELLPKAIEAASTMDLVDPEHTVIVPARTRKKEK